jgi:cullin-associated NEDD8-dissociated protein 1
VVALDLISLSKESSPNIKRNALEALATIIHFSWHKVESLIPDIT